MALSIPFNNQPVSTLPKTGSYTLVGTYARVKVTDYSVAFTVNGNTIIPQLCVDSSYASNSAAGTIYRNQTGYTLKCYFDFVGVGGAEASGVYGSDQTGTSGINTTVYDQFGARAYYASPTTETSPFILMPPESFIHHAVNGSSGTVHYKIFPETSPNEWFWVPANAALVGGEYIVEEFNVIT